MFDKPLLGMFLLLLVQYPIPISEKVSPGTGDICCGKNNNCIGFCLSKFAMANYTEIMADKLSVTC